MSITVTTDVTLELTSCASCGVLYGITDRLQKARRADKENFYCPNGHANVYRENEADRLRAELKKRDQELADEALEKRKLENKLAAAEKAAKRLASGVCSCCNRTFRNLASHMKTKHPEVLKKLKVTQ